MIKWVSGAVAGVVLASVGVLGLPGTAFATKPSGSEPPASVGIQVRTEHRPERGDAEARAVVSIRVGASPQCSVLYLGFGTDGVC